MNSNWSYSPKTLNSGQNRWFFLSHVTLKFDRWPWKTTGHLFYAALSFVHHFIIICEFKLELQPETAKLGFDLRDLDLWLLTLTFCMDLTSVIGNNSWMFHDVRWWEHSEKGVTDGRADGRTDKQIEWTIHRAAWPQLKTQHDTIKQYLMKRKLSFIVRHSNKIPQYRTDVMKTYGNSK